jgi:hypothetical protein
LICNLFISFGIWVGQKFPEFFLFQKSKKKSANNIGFCASVAGRKYNRLIANPIFSSGWTNIAEHFILTSTLVFQSAAVVGGRNANATPAQSPARWL